MNLLIADDEQYIRTSLTEDIDWCRYGFNLVGTAASGREVLEQIPLLKPEIILSDIMMPDLTGLELIKELRVQDSKIPVIFLSGWSSFDYAREALKYGASNYLLKPCPDEEIIEALLEIKNKLQDSGLEPAKEEPEKQPHSKKHVIQLACEWIHEDIINGSTLTYISERVNMNASAFSRLFHQEMGCSFKKYVTAVKINKAKKLLLETNIKIQHLAEQLGYVSTSHFVQVFSKNTGMTPGSFRENHLH